MKKATWAALLAAVLALAVAVFCWIEAGKEIRVLCSLFGPGDDISRVVRVLDTGEWLRYRISSENGREVVHFDSPWTLGTTRCRVTVADRRVQSSEYTAFGRPRWLGGAAE